MRLACLAVLALVFSAEVAAQSDRRFWCDAGGIGTGAGDEEIYVRADPSEGLGVTISVLYNSEIYTRHLELDGQENSFSECDLSIITTWQQAPRLFDSQPKIPINALTTFEFTVNALDVKLEGADPITETFTYVYCSSGPSVAPLSFYCPRIEMPANAGTPDVVFVQDERTLSNGETSHMHSIPYYAVNRLVNLDQYPDEYFGSPDSLIPYDFGQICSPDFCSGDWPRPLGFFAAKQTAPFRFHDNLTQYESEEWMWNLSGDGLSFAPDAKLSIEGQLEVEGMTLAATDPAQPWNGIRVHDPDQDGTGGDLTLGPGTVVQGVSSVWGAVRAYSSGLITLDGATVRDNPAGPGVVSYGGGTYGGPTAPAGVTITGGTEVFGHAEAGVSAQNGGSVLIDDAGVVISSNAVGVEATRGNARVLVTAGTIEENDGGPGVRAASSGTVDLWEGYGSGGTSSRSVSGDIFVLNNIGGLYAESGTYTGGTVTTASNVVCVRSPCPYTVTGQVDLVGNRGELLDQLFDMVAQTGSYVDATENYWNTDDPDEVEFPASHASRISYLPILTTSPSVTGDTASSAARGPGPALRGGEGQDFTGIALAVATADRLRLGNGFAEAAAALLDAFGAAETDEDRALVAAGAVRLVHAADAEPLVAWATGAAAVPGAERPWARRVLVEALLVRGETSAAGLVAQALATEEGTVHQMAGLTLGLRVALADRDQAAAERVLGDVAALDAEVAAELTVMAAAGLGEIALTPSAGGGFAKADATNFPETMTVWPNPTTGALSVRLSAGLGAVEVALFDALGRRVATLYDGESDPELSGALELSYDGRSLAPGLYVIRVRSEAGTTAQAVTVAR